MLKYAIMSYIPQRYMRRADLEKSFTLYHSSELDGTRLIAIFDTQDTMRHILDFKAGRKYATKWAAELVARTLAPMDLTNTIIVCIPASCEQTNKRRYKRFSASVCEKCKAINGFEHIQVIGKREKVHISRKHDKQTASNVQIDADYFNGKRVLLIDDICTTCATSRSTSCRFACKERIHRADAEGRSRRENDPVPSTMLSTSRHLPFSPKTKSYRRFEHPRPTGKQRTPSFARLSTNGALGNQRDKKKTTTTDGL